VRSQILQVEKVKKEWKFNSFVLSIGTMQECDYGSKTLRDKMNPNFQNYADPEFLNISFKFLRCDIINSKKLIIIFKTS
jgi:hypothetical protein